MKLLAALLRDRILPMFRDVPWEFHPWWWPMRTGATQVDYFSEHLTTDEIEKCTGMAIGQVMESVQGGAFNQSSANDYRYDGFLGFWGEKISGDVQFVLISDRPSRSHYPAGLTTRLVNLLRRLGLTSVHFTDFIKRRGEASSAVLPPGDGLAQHADILVEEIACIVSAPPRVCVIPVQERTQRWLIEHRIAECLERRLGGGRVLLPNTYAVFWSRRGWSDHDVYNQWSRVLTQCSTPKD